TYAPLQKRVECERCARPCAPKPVRPRSRLVLAVPPGAEGVAAEAVNENDVGLARGVVTAGNAMQAAQWRPCARVYRFTRPCKLTSRADDRRTSASILSVHAEFARKNADSRSKFAEILS